MKWLIFGDGWIAGYVKQLLTQMNEEYIIAKSRADNEQDVEKELLEVKPDRVISLIGRTSGPGFNTIDYLEQKGKLVENIRDNLYGPFVLAMTCKKHNIFLVYLGTGCIFENYNDGKGHTEDDKPNFFASNYSVVKGFSDRLMHFFENNVLNVRIRMPCVPFEHNRNFITKIMNYKKICSIPNSITCLPTLLPVMIDMAKKKTSGTINLVNPGLISHNEILQMVKDIIDPMFTWENFSLQEQSEILLAGRSNNLLNTDKLLSMYPNIPDAKDDIRNLLYEMKKNMGK